MNILVWSFDTPLTFLLTSYLATHKCLITVVTDYGHVDELPDQNWTFMLLVNPTYDQLSAITDQLERLGCLPIYLFTNRLEPRLCELSNEVGINGVFEEPLMKLFGTMVNDQPKVREPTAERSEGNESPICLGEFKVDLPRRVLYKHHERVELTKRETEVLSYMLCNPNRVIDREELLMALWDNLGADSNVYITIRNLRKKLEDDINDPKIIITNRGGGYSLRR
ncbi:winged helix family transcriptional regulator [Paenibacillus sp. MMS18-CY102]|uniref:winged helix family transcriptional regulator n=1 Tax=Paenibacillus sp. MMS18-CY102 TaxID=2682849 RepID=UPI0013658B42|nr:winged helix family transcriptional regulator [Paenibacillus sp. MMS18-CY102]MWC28564.1 hypothetical protein [Paenibacillus sp. MMS18-CY102]